MQPESWNTDQLAHSFLIGDDYTVIVMESCKRSKLVFGVGINDCDYPSRRHEKVSGKRKIIWTCPFYRAWKNMLERCYSASRQARFPSYVGCQVTPEWHRFSTFKGWMEAQDWEGKHLDKDILTPGNKVYSPDSCIFVNGALNLFLTDSAAARGDWPIGVCWHKRDRAFQVECRNPFTGKRERLGYFTDPAEAHEAWRKRKHELSCQYADLQTDSRIANALRSRFANDEITGATNE